MDSLAYSMMVCSLSKIFTKYYNSGQFEMFELTRGLSCNACTYALLFLETARGAYCSTKVRESMCVALCLLKTFVRVAPQHDWRRTPVFKYSRASSERIYDTILVLLQAWFDSMIYYTSAVLTATGTPRMQANTMSCEERMAYLLMIPFVHHVYNHYLGKG